MQDDKYQEARRLVQEEKLERSKECEQRFMELLKEYNCDPRAFAVINNQHIPVGEVLKVPVIWLFVPLD